MIPGLDNGDRGPYATKPLSDGRVASADPLTFGRARLHVGPPNVAFYDDAW